MKTLEIIKNEYAERKGCESWSTFTFWLEPEEIEAHMDKICILVQQEQQKIIAENAKVEIKTTKNDNPSVITKYENEDGFIKVNTESIINDKNIIR